jgi:hypothetical protein
MHFATSSKTDKLCNGSVIFYRSYCYNFVPSSLWLQSLLNLLIITYHSVDVNQVPYSAHLSGTDFHGRGTIILLYLINSIYFPNQFTALCIFISFLTLLEWKLSLIFVLRRSVNNNFWQSLMLLYYFKCGVECLRSVPGQYTIRMLINCTHSDVSLGYGAAQVPSVCLPPKSTQQQCNESNHTKPR